MLIRKKGQTGHSLMPDAPARAAWILVVDDDETMLFTLRRSLLRNAPHDLEVGVETASTPEAGLAALDARCDEPLVVLSDFDLKASVNGVGFLAQVAERCPSARRILYSGHTRDEVAPLLEGSRVEAFYEKPFCLEELLEPLYAQLERVAAPVAIPEPEGVPSG